MTFKAEIEKQKNQIFILEGTIDEIKKSASKQRETI